MPLDSGQKEQTDSKGCGRSPQQISMNRRSFLAGLLAALGFRRLARPKSIMFRWRAGYGRVVPYTTIQTALIEKGPLRPTEITVDFREAALVWFREFQDKENR